VVDDLADRPHIAVELARCMLLGWKPGYLTIEELRAAIWSCSNGAPVSRPPHTIRASSQPDAAVYRATGTITYRVTVKVNSRVIATTEDEAHEVLFEELAPVALADDEADIEYEDDDLRLTCLDAQQNHPLSGVDYR